MKRLTLFSIVLFLLVAGKSIGQIPNQGFENWISAGSYNDPESYKTTNFLMIGSFHPVTRSTDHYPSSIGNYSIRLESQSSTQGAVGLAVQSDDIMNGLKPTFPIVGHPGVFTGYFKFTPQNGDTLLVLASLYKNGVEVSTAAFIYDLPQNDWASFSVPFPEYIEADSGAIMLSSYLFQFAGGGGQPPLPNGNSILYVDNISFDSLITTIQELPANQSFSACIYPNPAQESITIETTGIHTFFKLYDITGRIAGEIDLKNESTNFNISHLQPGIYLATFRNTQGILIKKEKVIIE
ncbi:MAG: T9SS type A sorting domain-containing protein [Bacteroidales bacterium]|nr:T9SS type A sorting domain-containing protein [Bacteroidales bacterium]